MKRFIHKFITNYYIQKFIIYGMRIALRIFYIVPVRKNRILFCAHEGKAYNCNPKYIFEQLYKEDCTTYEYIWCINQKNRIPEGFNITVVNYLSLRYLFYLMTSSVIINDVGVEPFIPKRKGQLLINTWHGGGAYKKGKPNDKYKRNFRAAITDYVISSCRKFSEVCSDELFFNIDINKFLPIGMPRNDVFFNYEQTYYTDIRQHICDLYNIDSSKMLILYAPTFRGTARDPHNKSFITNFDEICDSVKHRFNKDAVVMYRCHTVESFTIGGAIDINDYQDMQDILIAADILITDYSSSIWDYSFTYKPGFLYTPDLNDYIGNTGLHTDIDKWQYPHAMTLNELSSLIRDYDEEKAIERIKQHHKDMGSYETGTATASICKIIKEHIDCIMHR